jgi:hypothetical protein
MRQEARQKTGKQRRNRRSTSSTSSSCDIELDDEEVERIHEVYATLTDNMKTIEQHVDLSTLRWPLMSIAESERAIIQGTAVARLTKLVFIFIPLNFA